MKKLLIPVLVIGTVLMCVIMIESDTATGYFQIAEKMGFQDVEKTPYEVVEFTIPEEFSPVYERYNSLLEENGYSLVPYKGKKCIRYTYLIPSLNARANIIVYNNKVIGGDVSGITIDGVMIPIIKG